MCQNLGDHIFWVYQNLKGVCQNLEGVQFFGWTNFGGVKSLWGKILVGVNKNILGVQSSRSSKFRVGDSNIFGVNNF